MSLQRMTSGRRLARTPGSGVIGGVVYFQAAGYDQPDEDEIANLESIELKELRSDFESGAFFWK